VSTPIPPLIMFLFFQRQIVNHYALGAVADWLHRAVGGLAALAPGYRALEMRPQPGGGLTNARARHLTSYGMAECAWRIVGGQIDIEAIVPPNTTATVVLPNSPEEPRQVGSGTYRWSYPFGSEAAPAVARRRTS
jgi:alpha-L-rhamnosidase